MPTVTEALAVGMQSHQVGNLKKAERIYRQILHADPGNADALHLLGIMACQVGKQDLAIQYLGQALAQFPDNPVFHANLGVAYQALGRLPEASRHFQEALRLKPDYAEACNNLAATLTDQGHLDEAEKFLRQALRLKPEFADGQANLGKLLARVGKMEEATAGYRQALCLRPTPKLRLAAATLLPPIYQSLNDLKAWRQRLTDNLRQLHEAGVTLDLTHETAPTCFFLAYQGRNDRDLQRDLARRYVPPRDVPGPTADQERTGGKIKIGFISRSFRDHTIGHLMRGLMAHLSREAFEVTVLSVGSYRDEVAQFIQQHADHYLGLPSSLPECRRLIAGQGLDVLFYADVGMDPLTYSLAFSRLAPVQCATWGHPLTTGIDTIDYFISSDLLETSEAAEHYTEQLIRLKALPIYYYRPSLPAQPKSREVFGLAADGHLYGCLQSLFKLHPEFDPLLAEILRADPKGILVLIHGQSRHWDEMLLQRFRTIMPDVVDRVHFVAGQKREDFLSLNATMDVLLDPLHFGGGNTSYEALALGVPIVTLPSPFLRGRISLALYQQMNVRDCVAVTAEDYVRIAVKLGTDAAYREAIRAKILAANGVLYENLQGVRELEQFLVQIMKKIRK